ncbi:LysR family transcriptional regulator [Thalassotalea ponticola]|uniref:LysR family transcriptional regulator n=1 Tax=Thalassotalea ponticola TaxID=1523392 RepID=UPI0025B3C5BE|nr:LysR family transcriptional regulator [Thalassotalea ponticola]MDN3652840.1 LysR family transcriptional regulator [Thalassotalea ponticola]
MINTTWLKTFCTLVDIGHFTQTAESLYMTQPGVSQHIKKLEQSLKTQLLLRQGKSFSLTPAGQALYKQGKEILLALDSVEHSLNKDDPHSGSVTLMSPGSIGLKLYPFLLDKQRQFKQLIINYGFSSNSAIIDSLLAGKCDLGIITQQITSTDLIYQQVATEPLVLVTAAGINDISWSNLQKLGFISHPDAMHHGNLLLAANYPQFKHLSDITQRGFSNQISLILEPVCRGLGFTVLPLHAASAFTNQADITIHQLNHLVSEPIYICYRRFTPLMARQRLIIDWIEQQLAL